MRYDSGAHSVFSLNYHLILVVKFRRKTINDPVSERLRQIFEMVGALFLDEWNHDHDHIHALIHTYPGSNLVQFINSYKFASSRIIKQEFPWIRKLLWKQYFWSRSYCLLTTGGATIDVIRRYIENQGH